MVERTIGLKFDPSQLLSGLRKSQQFSQKLDAAITDVNNNINDLAGGAQGVVDVADALGLNWKVARRLAKELAATSLAVAGITTQYRTFLNAARLVDAAIRTINLDLNVNVGEFDKVNDAIKKAGFKGVSKDIKATSAEVKGLGESSKSVAQLSDKLDGTSEAANQLKISLGRAGNGSTKLDFEFNTLRKSARDTSNAFKDVSSNAEQAARSVAQLGTNQSQGIESLATNARQAQTSLRGIGESTVYLDAVAASIDRNSEASELFLAQVKELGQELPSISASLAGLAENNRASRDEFTDLSVELRHVQSELATLNQQLKQTTGIEQTTEQVTTLKKELSTVHVAAAKIPTLRDHFETLHRQTVLVGSGIKKLADAAAVGGKRISVALSADNMGQGLRVLSGELDAAGIALERVSAAAKKAERMKKLGSVITSTVATAKAIGLSYEETSRFIRQQGIAASKMQQIALKFNALNAVVDNTKTIYRALNQEFGVTQQQFKAIESVFTVARRLEVSDKAALKLADSLKLAAEEAEELATRDKEVLSLATSLEITFDAAKELKQEFGRNAETVEQVIKTYGELRNVSASIADIAEVMGDKFDASSDDLAKLQKRFNELVTAEQTLSGARNEAERLAKTLADLKDESSGLLALANTFSISFDEAKKLRAELGLTSNEILEAASRYKELDEANVNLTAKFNILSAEMGITATNVLKINNAIEQSNAPKRLASQLNELETSLKKVGSDTGNLSAIATTFDSTFGAAEKLVKAIGATPEVVSSAVTRLLELKKVGADNFQVYNALSGEFQLNRRQIILLREEVDNFQGLKRVAAEAKLAQEALAQIGSDRGSFSSIASTLGITFEAAQALSKGLNRSASETQNLVDAYESLQRSGASTKTIFASLKEEFAASDVEISKLVQSFKRLEVIEEIKEHAESFRASIAEFKSETDGVLELSSALRITHTQARTLSEELEVSASTLASASTRMIQLSKAGFDSAEVMAALKREFQLVGSETRALRGFVDAADELDNIERAATEAREVLANFGASTSAISGIAKQFKITYEAAQALAFGLSANAQESRKVIDQYESMRDAGAELITIQTTLNALFGTSKSEFTQLIGAFDQRDAIAKLAKELEGAAEAARKLGQDNDNYIALAKSLNLSYGEARELSLGLNESSTAAATMVRRFNDLRDVGTNTGATFAILNKEFGTTVDSVERLKEFRALADDIARTKQEAKDLAEELKQLGASADLVAELASAFKLDYQAAKQLASGIDLSSEATRSAVGRFKQLNDIGADTSDIYAQISKELSITADSFKLIDAAAKRVQGLKQLEKEATATKEALADIGADRSAIGNIASTFKLAYQDAKDFIDELGLGAQETQKVVAAFKELETAGASLDEGYDSLASQFGITRSQLEAINAQAERLDAVKQAAKDIETLSEASAKIGADTTGIIGLAKALKLTFTQAEDLGNLFERGASQANTIAQAYISLRDAGADTGQAFAKIALQFGITSDELVGLEKAFNKFDGARKLKDELKALSDSRDEVGKLSDNLTSVADTFGLTIRQASNLSEQLNLSAEDTAKISSRFIQLKRSGANLRETFDLLHGEFGVGKKELNQLNKRFSKLQSNLKKAGQRAIGFAEDLRRGVTFSVTDGALDVLSDSARGAVDSIGDLVKGSTELSNTYDASEKSVLAVARSVKEGNFFFENLKNTTAELGINLSDVQGAYLSFLNSAQGQGDLNAVEINDYFEGITRLGAAFGLSGDQIALSFKGAEQALGNNKLLAEELNQIMDSLPIGAADLREGLGLTTEEFRDMRKNGTLPLIESLIAIGDAANSTADKILPSVLDSAPGRVAQLSRQFRDLQAEAGSAGQIVQKSLAELAFQALKNISTQQLGFSDLETTANRFSRELANNPAIIDNTTRAITELTQAGIGGASNAAEGLVEFLDNEEKVEATVDGMIKLGEAAATLVGYTDEFVNALGAAVKHSQDIYEGLAPAGRALYSAINVGSYVADRGPGAEFDTELQKKLSNVDSLAAGPRGRSVYGPQLPAGQEFLANFDLDEIDRRAAEKNPLVGSAIEDRVDFRLEQEAKLREAELETLEALEKKRESFREREQSRLDREAEERQKEIEQEANARIDLLSEIYNIEADNIRALHDLRINLLNLELDARKLGTDEFTRDGINQASQVIKTLQDIDRQQQATITRLSDAQRDLSDAIQFNQEIGSGISLNETIDLPSPTKKQQATLDAANNIGRSAPVSSGNPSTVGSSQFFSPLRDVSLAEVIAYEPLAGQRFGARRDYGPHAGIDYDSSIGAGVGGAIQAVQSGFASIHSIGSTGAEESIQVRVNFVDAQGRDIEQRYNHLSQKAVSDALGLGVGGSAQIEAGQLLGAVGETDDISSGPHLDFKTYVNDVPINPSEYFRDLQRELGEVSTNSPAIRINVTGVAPAPAAETADISTFAAPSPEEIKGLEAGVEAYTQYTLAYQELAAAQADAAISNFFDEQTSSILDGVAAQELDNDVAAERLKLTRENSENLEQELSLLELRLENEQELTTVRASLLTLEQEFAITREQYLDQETDIMIALDQRIVAQERLFEIEKEQQAVVFGNNFLAQQTESAALLETQIHNLSAGYEQVTAVQQAMLQAQRENITLTAEQIQAMIEAEHASVRLSEEFEAMNEVRSLGIQVEESLVDGFTNMTKAAFTAGESVGGAIGNMVSSILDSLATLALNNIFKDLFGNVFTGGFGGGQGAGNSSITSGILSIFGFAEGGIIPGGTGARAKAYASGGIVTQPEVALIGEGSMNEAIVPLPNGRSIPVEFKGLPSNHSTSNAINISTSVNITNKGTSTSTQTGRATDRQSELLNAKILDVILNEQRPGGILAD